VLSLRQDRYLHDAVGDASHAGSDGRKAGAVVATVGHHRDVGAQEVRVPLNELGQELRAALLHALHQDLDAHPALARERPEGGGMDHDAGLVVGSSTAVQPSVADLGLERR
jgi:hypothetical protein